MKIVILLVLSFSFLCSFINPAKENNTKGKKAFQEQDYDLALDHFNNSFKEIPSDPKLSYNLGNTYLFKNEYDKAISFFNESLTQIKTDELNKGEELYFNLYFGLGNSYFYKKNFKQAIANYKQALKINHNNRSLKKNLELAIKELQEEKQNQQEKNKPENNANQPSSEQQPSASDERNNENSTKQNETKKTPLAKENSAKHNQKAIDKKTAEAILKAFETRHQDALIKKRYQQKSSSASTDKNW